MEMLQLRYFYETAMSESIAKTAQKYMVPPSSVSASIKRLERELGAKLFVRTANRIVLSEKGKRLLDAVGNTLIQLDIAVSEVSAAPTEKQTISVLACSTRETLVRLIARFQRMYSSVSFKLAFNDVPENYEKYDIIINSPEDELADYESFFWRRFHGMVEALDTDPLCRGPVTLSQLRDRQFVTTSTQGSAFKAFAQACERQGFTPKVLLECDDYKCRNLAILSGVCLGVNFRSSSDIIQPNMQFLNISDFDEELIINVYYKKEIYDGNIKLFLDLLKSSALRP